MDNNISSVVKDGLCTGCGTCVALCPRNALELVIEKRSGLYAPNVNTVLCNNCGLCYRVCPGHEVDFSDLNLKIFQELPQDEKIGNYYGTYTGYSTNNDLRLNAASGGMVTQLLNYLLKSGAITGALVVKAGEIDPLVPEPFIARTEEEIVSAISTKYCPVPANICLREIISSSRGENKYAVVGLPCHIHGIRKAAQYNKKLNEKILLYVGLFCLSTNSFNATRHILHKNRVDIDDVRRIDYRGKGWPGKMTIEFKNGRNLVLGVEEYYDEVFSAYKPGRCLLCPDHACELSDISFADAWHLRGKDTVGTSIIVTRNETSDKIINEMKTEGLIRLNPCTADEVHLSQNNMIHKKDNLRYRLSVFKPIGVKIPNIGYHFEDVQKRNRTLNENVKKYIIAILDILENRMAMHNMRRTLELFLKYKVLLRKKERN